MEGYAKVALLMGQFPDVAIFKRYSALNTQNILYLQAKLEHLENKLRNLAYQDETSNIMPRRYYSKDWFCLQESGSPIVAEGSDCRQWKTFLEIRETLKEYNIAILQQQALANLDEPTPKTLERLQDWMTRPDRGNISLFGEDRMIWSDTKLCDLLVLKTVHREDPLSKWINDKFLCWYRKKFGKDRPAPPDSPHLANTVINDDTKIHFLARLAITVIGCLLPVISIAILHCMDSFLKRLTAIAVLTAVFSFTLALLTSARVVDIFTATAAFAAVTVVFVGTDPIPLPATPS